MTLRRLLRAAVPTFLSTLGLLGSIRPAAGQSYGLGDQVLTFGAASFHPDTPSQTYSFNFGYLFGAGTFRAPLNLPDGAEVFQICIYGLVTDPGTDVDVGIVGVSTPDDGSLPFYAYVDGSEVAFVDNVIGYGKACTTPDFSWVFHDEVDFDGNGSLDATVYYLYLRIEGATPGFGSTRVWWRRQVSPAPATPTFNDVASSDFGFAYIEALAASGITGGCGSGNYCPDAPLTRRQMAIFLAKALGLHWPL